ncbi:MAG: sodium:solute symporter family protein [Acidobacteria bacterium]|nr:MAG: sodium:solute symporter family protein [Acidobacteriota bacterium]
MLPVVFLYLGLVLAIGLWSHRMARSTGEDFFVAGRTIGPFVLLMTLFGTHMTAFALLGASGESYRIGIGVFGLMASSSALIAPTLFFFVGMRVWRLGKQYGYVTQVELLSERFQSPLLGLCLFPVLAVLLVPYLLIGVMGGGITLSEIGGDAIPTWVGSVLITAVVLVYVCFGGLRGTAWVNTFQTCFFMVIGAVTVWLIVGRLGGLETAMARVAESHPEMLVRGDNVRPLQLLTYLLIPASVGMFPHIFQHWLSARRAATFRAPVILYPACILIVWLPSVLLGVFGRIDFPDLVGPQANSVLVRMIALYSPGVLGGLLAAGVFAAIMSSLDSQSLALGTMFTRDVMPRLLGRKLADGEQVLAGRLFLASVLLLTLGLSFVVNRSIFGLAVWCFTGYTALLPILIGALFWRRATAAGALASLATAFASWLYFFRAGWGKPDYSVLGSGAMPVAVIVPAAALALIVVSLLTRPPDTAVVERFVGDD